MCILFLYVGNENNPTIICNNRDEYYSRATNRGIFTTKYQKNTGNGEKKVDNKNEEEEEDDDDDCPYYCSYAPKDLVAGGTWLQFDKIAHPNKPLRYAIVLNFHHWREYNAVSFIFSHWNVNMAQLLSRGKLVSGFMNNPKVTAKDYAEEVYRTRNSYRPFNLIVSDASDQTYYISSSIKQFEVRRLLPGHLYGITNGYIEDHWEKTALGKEMMQELIDTTLGQIDFKTIQKIHTERTPHASPMEGSFYSTSVSTNLVPASSSESSSKQGSMQMLNNTTNQSTGNSSYNTSLSPSAEPSFKGAGGGQDFSFQRMNGNQDDDNNNDNTYNNNENIFTPQKLPQQQQQEVLFPYQNYNNPFPTPLLTDQQLHYPRIQELLNYEGKVFTHYPFINNFLEQLLEIMNHSQILADPTFHRSSLPLMQLASIFVTPTIIIKDEKLTFWTRMFGTGKFRLLPDEINNQYEQLDENEVDVSEIFGTRTITLLVYFDGNYMKNQKILQLQQEKDEEQEQEQEQDQQEKALSSISGRDSVDSNGCRDVDSVPTSSKPQDGGSAGEDNKEEKNQAENQKEENEPCLFALIESDYVLNENDNYNLVKSTNIFTNL